MFGNQAIFHCNFVSVAYNVIVIRTASIPIQVDEAKCFLLMEKCAEIFNAHVDWALENKSWSKKLAHKAIYTNLVNKYNDVPTGLIQTVRDTALEAVKAPSSRLVPRNAPMEPFGSINELQLCGSTN